MGPREPRSCRHCLTDVPEHDLTCPGCGRYFDGGFDLPDLIDGIRAWQPPSPPPDQVAPGRREPLLPAVGQVEMPEPAGTWWSEEVRRPAPPPARSGDGHLPHVGEVTGLPYASREAGAADDEVIDLRDPPPQPEPDRSRPARSWLRSRSRT